MNRIAANGYSSNGTVLLNGCIIIFKLCVYAVGRCCHETTEYTAIASRGTGARGRTGSNGSPAPTLEWRRWWPCTTVAPWLFVILCSMCRSTDFCSKLTARISFQVRWACGHNVVPFMHKVFFCWNTKLNFCDLDFGIIYQLSAININTWVALLWHLSYIDIYVLCFLYMVKLLYTDIAN